MSRIRKVYIWYLLILIHLGAFAYQLYGGRYMLKDSEEYVLAAENLFQHGVLYSGVWEEPYRADFFTKRPPVYPIFIGITGGYRGLPWVLLLLQNLLSLLNIGLAFELAYLLLEESGKQIDRQKIPVFVCFLILLYPAQWIYANLVMTEILFQSWLSFGIYSLVRALQGKSLTWLSLYTLCISLAMFTKPVMYVFVLPHFLGVLALGYYWKKPQTLFAAIIPLLAIWGYQSWNESRTGYAHFSSIQNLSLFQYTTYNLLGQEYGLARATEMNDSILEVMFTLPDYKSQQELIADYSQEVILSHPFSYAGMHLKGMLNFLVDPGRFELYHFWNLEKVGGKGLQRTFSEEGYTGIWRYISQQALGIWVCLGLILVGNLIRWGMVIWALIQGKISLVLRIVIGIFILYLVGITGTSGASRFALPLFPVTLSLVYTWMGMKSPE